MSANWSSPIVSTETYSSTTKDGSYKSFVKLDADGIWHPSLFVALPSGSFLGTGQKWDRLAREYFPFTAIFSSNGTLLKEVHLEDDDYIHKQATSGDPRFVPSGSAGRFDSMLGFHLSLVQFNLEGKNVKCIFLIHNS